MSSSRPLVPEWLHSPRDANELQPGVWPESAVRDPDGVLTIGGVSAHTLRAEFGTPLYVMDEGEFRARARRVRAAFEAAAQRHGTSARVYYAGKAFLSTAIVRWVSAEGLRVDVATGGELAIALAGGADPAKVGMHGNNKSVAELERAVAVGVGSVIIDSPIEVERLAVIADRAGVVQPVLVRVASGVHAETHDFLSTAHEDQKFGLPPAQAAALVARIRELPSLRFLGLHGHIGSQIFDTAGFAESASRLIDLHADLRATGPIEMLNLGGGFGIAYTAADLPPVIEDVAEQIVDAVARECAARGIPIPALAFEPGRVIAGPAGVTLYEVGTIKPVQVTDSLVRTYVSVDGGMSDNVRPALYDADYSVRIASSTSDAEPALVRVVGRHCESGDIVVYADYLPGDVTPGDLVAVPGTGAYSFSLSSNYNAVPRPAVVAVSDGAAHTIVRGETIDDVLARDVGIEEHA